MLLRFVRSGGGRSRRSGIRAWAWRAALTDAIAVRAKGGGPTRVGGLARLLVDLIA
jgi:hypothetical protein